VVDGLFVASLLSPWKTKQSPADTWDNVKIPLIEVLENTSRPDTDGWYSLPATGVEYSSLIGTPISNIQDANLNTTLTIETSYWYLDCPVLSSVAQPPNANLSSSPWETSPGNSGTLASNVSAFRYPRLNGSVPANLPARTIIYNSWDPAGGGSTTGETGSVCNIYTTYVEVDVSCAGLACAAQWLRHSMLPHPPRNWTLLDQQGLVWAHFSEIFVSLIGGHSATATGVQVYFVNPQNPFNATSSQPLRSLPPERFARSLAQLFNTVWAAMMGMNAITDGLTNYTSSQNATTLEEFFVASTATTAGTQFRSIEVIECHNGWLAALSVASLAMVIASLVHPVIRMLRHAPNLVLNISTMVKDSPYVGLPSTGSTLDSADRARLVKRIKVCLGDVASEDDVGHIAIGSVSGEHRVARVRKGRLYD